MITALYILAYLIAGLVTVVVVSKIRRQVAKAYGYEEESDPLGVVAVILMWPVAVAIAALLIPALMLEYLGAAIIKLFKL